MCSKDAKYREVADAYREKILSGGYAPGAKLPSVQAICRCFGVSHLTAVKAVEVLRKAGLVKSRNGVGTFVVRRMTSVGLLVPMMKQTEIFPPICREFSRLCLENGMTVDFADISSVRADMQRRVVVEAARRMVANGVSGAVFHPVDFGRDALRVSREVLRTFREADVPVVVLDAEIEPSPGEDRFDFVGVDNFEIGRFAGRHVIERGAKRIAFVAWSDESLNVTRRLDGLSSAVAQKLGAKICSTHLWLRDEAAMASAWKRRLPDAVVCTSDLVAAHVLKLLAGIGRKCPEDVLVTGVNDVDLATLVSPALTTVRQPCADLAAAAFETLRWRIANPGAEKRRVAVATNLVVRESTGGCKGASA